MLGKIVLFLSCHLSRASACNPAAVVNLVASSVLSNSACFSDPETGMPCPYGSICSAWLEIVILTQEESIGFG